MELRSYPETNPASVTNWLPTFGPNPNKKKNEDKTRKPQEFIV